RRPELVVALHAPVPRHAPLAVADARRRALRAAAEQLLARRRVDLLDDRHAEQAVLVPERDWIAYPEVLVVRDIAVPGVVRVDHVVIARVTAVAAIVPCGHEQPGSLRAALLHVPQLGTAARGGCQCRRARSPTRRRP